MAVCTTSSCGSNREMMFAFAREKAIMRRSPPRRRAIKGNPQITQILLKQSVYSADRQDLRMQNLIEQFLEHLRYERNVSTHTLRNYSSDLEQFLQFLTAGEKRNAPD